MKNRKHVYVYHWDRIIGASVIFLVLVGLVGYGLSLWSDSAPEEEFDMAATQPEAAVAVEDTQTQLFNKAVTAEEPARQFAENKLLETEPSLPEIAEFSITDHADEETSEETLVNKTDLEDSEPVNAAQPIGEMPEIPPKEVLSEPLAEISQNISLPPQRENLDSADTTLAVDTPNSPFQLKELEILKPSVKRFLLARTVLNREPKGDLNEIRFNADGIAAVWAYSEVIDKKGSRLKYVWLHDGNKIATISVNVGSNRWRSKSSKLINQSMSGAWRVELQDGEERLMASVDFFLK